MAKLKKDFPGQPDLAAAGITTEKQLRDHIKAKSEAGEVWYEDIPNVGEVTALLVEEELMKTNKTAGDGDGLPKGELEAKKAGSAGGAADDAAAAPAAPVREFKAGTVFPFGDKRVRLSADVPFTLEDGSPLGDDAFAGLLAVSGTSNFQVNIGQLAPKRYSPSTGAYVPNECDTCGAVIYGDDEAKDCGDCVTAKAKAEEETKAEKETK